MRAKFDMILSALLVLAAVTMTVGVVHREFFSVSTNGSPDLEQPVQVNDWSTIASAGVRFGPSEPKVLVTVFSDFECPFCRAFHQTLQAVRAEQPGLVGVSFVHYPLAYHRFARPTAKAAECAALQGRFEQFADVAFSMQDSLGLASWERFGTLAGIPSLPQFQACISSTTTFARIDSGRVLGARLQLRGTPTVLIDSWRLPAAPDQAQLKAMIAAIQRGEPPVSAVR